MLGGGALVARGAVISSSEMSVASTFGDGSETGVIRSGADAGAGTDAISGVVTEVDDTSGIPGAAGTETSPFTPPPGPGIVLTPSLGGGADEMTNASASTGMLS